MEVVSFQIIRTIIWSFRGEAEFDFGVINDLSVRVVKKL